MLKNFWYACEFSSVITSKPKRVTLLNQEIVLYRNSKAEVVAASIEIPAHQSSVSIPKKATLDTYPVQEKYGLIWLFWGDIPENERPPLPLLAEFGNQAWRPIYGEFKWEAHYSRVLENQFDISHLPLVHPNSIGSGLVHQPQIEEHDVQMKQWGGSAVVTINQSKKVRSWSKTILNQQGSRPLRVTVSFYMPNISWLEFDFPIGDFRMIIFSSHLPIDANTTVSKWLVLRNFFTTSWADGQVRKSVLKPLREDKPVVESQNPKVVPHDLTAELHVPSDALSIAYRQLRRKYLDMGWGIEPHISRSDYTNYHIPADRQNLTSEEVKRTQREFINR